MNRNSFPTARLNTSIDKEDKQIIEKERVKLCAAKRSNLNQGGLVSIALHFWLKHRDEFSDGYSVPAETVNSPLAVSSRPAKQIPSREKKKRPAAAGRRSAA